MNDVRPFFGERSEPVGEWSLHWRHVSDGNRATVGDHLDARIAAFTRDGLCAMCKNDLDETGVCVVCGFNPAVPRQPGWTPEQADDYVPTLPQQLFVDEYAEANIDVGEVA